MIYIFSKLKLLIFLIGLSYANLAICVFIGNKRADLIFIVFVFRLLDLKYSYEFVKQPPF